MSKLRRETRRQEKKERVSKDFKFEIILASGTILRKRRKILVAIVELPRIRKVNYQIQVSGTS